MPPQIVVVDAQVAFLTAKVPADLPARIASFLDTQPAARCLATRYRNHPTAPCSTLMGWAGASSEDDTALHPLIAARVDTVIDKDTYSADLTGHLQPGGPVYLAGLDTDVCVQAIATALFDHGTDVHVVTDLCASSGGPSAHTAGLQVLRRIVGQSRLVRSADLATKSR
ncbi:isochorismatase family protein [Tsukamurella hominis]|uniref:isochorismatase family protein n=1 Tax=Tsukamurella hominis TaxID=1970232 RepID=UPI0039E920F5